MTDKHKTSVGDEDPWAILGVSVQADDDEIRKAYVQKIKDYPPDRAPEQFERIRDAYEDLRDPQRRSKRMIVSVDPEADLVSLLSEDAQKRRFVGAGPWLAVLNER